MSRLYEKKFPCEDEYWIVRHNGRLTVGRCKTDSSYGGGVMKVENTIDVYEVDDGATYWVAAESMKGAIDVMWQYYESAGTLEENPFQIEQATAARADKSVIKTEEGVRSVSEWACAAKEPTILGCSEWP